MAYRVVIAEDFRMIREIFEETVNRSPEYELEASFPTAVQAMEYLEKHDADLVLMDVLIPGSMNGLDAAGVILKNHPEARILLLTTFSDDEYIVKALKLGAKGYILKQNFDSIYPAITAVVNGQTVFGDEIMNKIPNLMTNEGGGESYAEFGLSEKEFNIIRLVADGLNNKEIAEKLFLGEGTVRNYISTILEKLDLRDRTQLAVFYYKHFN